MEDVLDVYQRPHDPRLPVVCLDETCKEIHGDAVAPIPPRAPGEGRPGAPARQDYEYVRGGSASIFMIHEPLAGTCHAQVRPQRTALEHARMIKFLCDVMYPDAQKIILVQDNLNTHTIGSLYTAFAPGEARRLGSRLEIHHTPVHGNWLNMAEIALRLLSGQCLARRLPSREKLAREVEAWRVANAKSPMKTDWRFTTEDARIRLKRLYPKVSGTITEN